MIVVLGLGSTGFSCAQFLAEQQQEIIVLDEKSQPPYLAALQQQLPQVPFISGQFCQKTLLTASFIVVSPGIDLWQPCLQMARNAGVPIISDIELFARHAKKPVIAITGSNGKSTVTRLVYHLACHAGKNILCGGNIGIPALSLLLQSLPDYYLLELSSFQLESTSSLAPASATVLNITPDHMDRYANEEEYAQAKLRIYHHCHIGIYNRDENYFARFSKAAECYYFSLTQQGPNIFSLISTANGYYLAFEEKLLLPVTALPQQGMHHYANALAALAIGKSIGLTFSSMLEAVQSFKSLPYRCQYIGFKFQMAWYNDSKATNVGAACAAIMALGENLSGKIILIAGGVAKNADFSPLLAPLKRYVRHVLVLGKAAQQLLNLCDNHVDTTKVSSLEDAVKHALHKGQCGDVVLLSPACASFDMFNDYQHRGAVFTQLIQAL